MKTGKRRAELNAEADILATAHEFAVSLHEFGAMDDAGMREMDRLCLPPRPDYTAPDVKRIRAATHMSQPTFARLLGVDKSSVAQWERGAKRPSGPALRLLEVLDPTKAESPVVQVRRGMGEGTV